MASMTVWRPPCVTSQLSQGTNTSLLGAITIQEQSIETILQPKGGSVTLGCTYTVDPSETGNLDIEWSQMNPDSTGLDKVILTYMDNAIVSTGPPSLMNRLSFNSADPSTGDASITITYLDIGDSMTFQCKVKKNPGVASRKVTLVVQAVPSNPRCLIEGEQYKGSDVILKCKSSEGTPPLSYKWQKIAGPSNPATPVLNMAPVTGDLLIKNISDVYAGAYQCNVGNRVGSGTCVVELSVSSANRTGIIVGAVFGALFLLLLLLLLIWCLICCCNKRRYEKDLANDIREDVAPPPSNTNSRASSVRTAAGYRAHNISYSLRRVYNEAPIDEPPALSVASSDASKPKYDSPIPTPEPVFVVLDQSPKHNPYNIQRVGGIPVMVPAQSREGFIV
ncbi:V-set and immunoglobulin domain-containing protein 8 [Hyla sarda]|uniref:V-set and immunoglobulin domain-containing protein 8 n=1 Tax=Hyla sarda TaxID=327740 RepID=UPI0024C2ABEA|nr:V-set and immunoglobulin domain-containing protein 8 [Hyla sarda]